MRNANRGADLRPLQFIPEPVVIELDPEEGWKAWDASLRDLEANTAEGRAMRLAEMPA